MHRIDHPTANTADPAKPLFTEGSPATGTPATAVTAQWLNAIQEELATVVEEAGLDLDPEDDTQLLQALAVLAAGRAFETQLLHVRDEKAQNTHGGTFTSGDWRTRDLNTVKLNQITGASLAANKVTLPAGTYFIQARAPARNCGLNQARLYDVTNSAVLIWGGNNDNETAIGTGSASFVVGRFTLAAPADIELQHRCTSTGSNTGFGSAANFGTEVYAEALIWKVA